MQGYASYTGGPVGFGDPNSKYISSTERSNVISKFVQEKLISELCVEEWKDWRKCIRGKRGEWFGTWKCKPKYQIFEQCQMRLLYDGGDNTNPVFSGVKRQSSTVCGSEK
ncbi:unnamed protein product [Schistosoma mattheei]|uniref:COX assembly mitochondrial protein n=1 Tax=Schistosoma mattheei TaxID=31246 RepID=A0AA85B2W2_9TREM|nr:unnamed protein product [Schistosoma mattheei]